MTLLGLAAVALLPPDVNVNSFFSQGIDAVVVGTAGDELADRGVMGQGRFIRDLLFEKARLVEDHEIDVARGVEGWPKAALVYGGEHVNSLMARIGPELAIRVEAHKLTIAEDVFEGDEYRVIAFIPGRARSESSPGWPDFIYYAGTGSPGVTEINAYNPGDDGFLVIDRFGPLAHGAWEKGEGGALVPRIKKRERRLPWREEDVLRESERWRGVRVWRLELASRKTEDPDEYAAIARGVRGAAEKLGLQEPKPIDVYVYPDRGSVRAITGKTYDGRADVESRSLHVLSFGGGVDGPLERLLRHEATHVLATDAFGPAGSSLLGEGLAVWVSGFYAGKSLEEWRANLTGPAPTIEELLGVAFQRLPEAQSYPLAGLFTRAAIELVGLDRFARHLYGATGATWASACVQAGTTAPEVANRFQSLLEP